MYQFSGGYNLMKNENKKGYQVKDLIVTALLAVCAVLLYMLCAILSFSPYTMLAVSPLWALLAGITYFLTAAKTKKPWAMFLFCTLTGIYGFYLPMIAGCIIAGVISALIAKKTGCTNTKTLTFSYIIYMVLAAFSGMYIPFLFFSKQTIEQYAEMFGDEYLGTLQTMVSPLITVLMLAVVAVCAFIGALIAKKMLKKHFEKAGML
jgi:energy-coupling factor transport system substrate-specific component